MATRYLCFIGDGHTCPPEMSLPAQNANLAVAHQFDQIVVLTGEEADVIPLDGNAGVIIGTLFDRSPPGCRITSLDTAAAKSALETQGQSLIERYWGAYVAILPGPNGSSIVMRDPSGGMPCYFLEGDNGHIITSDIETASSANCLQSEIDWKYLYRHLLAYDFRSSTTALKGVSELLAGHRLHVRGRQHQMEACWSPWDYVRLPVSMTDRDLANYIKEVVLNTVQAWAMRYNRVLLGVSGGLDSSIVAASAVTCNSQLHYLTMATDEAEGDERRYARQLAQALDVPLIERFHTLTDVDVTRPTSTHLPRPLQFAYGQSEHRTRRDLTDRLNIDAHFSGIGGDNVFCFMRSATPLLDRFLSERSFTGTMQTLEDVCDLTGCSRREALTQAIRRGLKGNATYRISGDRTFLTDLYEIDAPPLNHPWLEGPAHALPGKGVHISALARIQGTIDGFPRIEPPLVLPLLSQPVVEACLTIPTWKWIAGGRDRAVARDAFAGMLPKSLIDRRSKGGPNSFVFDVMNSSKGSLSELLIGGLLMQNGILDPVSVNAVLSSPAPLKAPDYMRLAAIAEAEAWARHWQTRLKPTKGKVAALSE